MAGAELETAGAACTSPGTVWETKLVAWVSTEVDWLAAGAACVMTGAALLARFEAVDRCWPASWATSVSTPVSWLRRSGGISQKTAAEAPSSRRRSMARPRETRARAFSSLMPALMATSA